MAGVGVEMRVPFVQLNLGAIDQVLRDVCVLIGVSIVDCMHACVCVFVSSLIDQRGKNQRKAESQRPRG